VRANYSYGQLVTPKSGKVRTVPMVPDMATALARLSQREHFTVTADERLRLVAIRLLQVDSPSPLLQTLVRSREACQRPTSKGTHSTH
jgi:hypothetical protein